MTAATRARADGLGVARVGLCPFALEPRKGQNVGRMKATARRAGLRHRHEKEVFIAAGGLTAESNAAAAGLGCSRPIPLGWVGDAERQPIWMAIDVEAILDDVDADKAIEM